MADGQLCRVCLKPVPAKSHGGPKRIYCSAKCGRRSRADYLKRWVDANREREKTRRLAYNQLRKVTHPDYFKKHYAANSERRKKQSSEWYRANVERALDTNRAGTARRRVEQPEHWLALKRKHTSKRRATQRQAFVENVDPRQVFSRDKGICCLCGKRVDVNSRWEVDHIVPLSKGGTHAYANVQLAHRRCNRAKGAKVQPGQPTLFQVASWNS